MALYDNLEIILISNESLMKLFNLKRQKMRLFKLIRTEVQKISNIVHFLQNGSYQLLILPLEMTCYHLKKWSQNHPFARFYHVPYFLIKVFKGVI